MPNELTCPNCGSVYDVSELPGLSTFNCPKCQTLLRIPGKFGPYLLDLQCGIGGTSHIYRARDSRNGDIVAVKILKNNYVTAGKNPFQREISLLETLPDIPGMVPILEYGVIAKRPFMAMPFYPGGDAEKRRRAHTLPPVKTLFNVFYELAETLGKLHEFHVSHHDIKSSNIFFDAEDRAFLGDLDVADFRADGDRSTPCLNWVSPAYSSPEKLENGSEDHLLLKQH